MGLIEFFIVVVLVMVFAAICVAALEYFAPGHPIVVDRIVWGVAILVIVASLAQAVGLLKYDPIIPRFH